VLWVFSVQFYVLTINALDDPKWANYTVPPDEFNQLSGEKQDNSQKLELERIFAQREPSVSVIFCCIKCCFIEIIYYNFIS